MHRLHQLRNYPNSTALVATLALALIFALLQQSQYYQHLDYTFLIAKAFLHGQLGSYERPSDLIELVHVGSFYYSVFPLGAVVSVLPFSFLTIIGLPKIFTTDLLIVLIASASFWFAYQLTFMRPAFSTPKRLLLSTWLIFGTWYLTNMLFAGAWQIALGLGVLGELGALYFALIKQNALLAGIMFALAFGNRTETILIAPILLAFLLRPHWQGRNSLKLFLRSSIKPTLMFLAVPIALGLATLIYNYARFASPFDFGYAHIAGVLNEPWYRHGIFSTFNIPLNAFEMLIALPNGFGGSIIFASPFLVLLARRPRGKKLVWVSALIGIGVLTLALWIHGNPGGWQYSYRYAMILLPWMLLLFIEWLPDSIQNLELCLWLLSVAVSSDMTYYFIWGNFHGQAILLY